MVKADIVIGANRGDEGKGTTVARLTKESHLRVLNVLTNGGAQRGHSVKTGLEEIVYSHFGSGTCYGADTYLSHYYLLSPMRFYQEYTSLILKPSRVYRDVRCRWTTIYDILANHLTEAKLNRHASCRMGIWNTIKRSNEIHLDFDTFMKLEETSQLKYLQKVKNYFERTQGIDSSWSDLWDNPNIAVNFLKDCEFMYEHTIPMDLNKLDYDHLIFENGQGLLLSDNGLDSYDRTPSNTGITYAKELLKDLKVDDVTAHYVSRTYITAHGDGQILRESSRRSISSGIQEDTFNHWNEGQGEFRYATLDLQEMHDRIIKDSGDVKFVLNLTHCDEIDLSAEAISIFGSDKVHAWGDPIV